MFNLLLLSFFALLAGLLYSFLSSGLTPRAPIYDFVLVAGTVLVIILIGLVILGAGGFRRTFHQLDELVEASHKVAEGDYNVRVEPKGTRGVRTLIMGFNSMVHRLQQNDQQRRSMLADVSHELRTPITVIQGNVEGILDGLYPADEARLRSILEETQILSRLVDDLRTMALAESGSLQLRREPVDLAPLIRDVVSGFDAQVQEKRIGLSMQLAEGEPVNIDPLRVREVITNLVSNAVRYTPAEGEIQVGLTESITGGERTVTVSVQDSGPGIPASDLPHIFDRFYKSSDSGGMGLGLSIAKYLVEAHGGKIWAESLPERGTRISFTLPAQETDKLP